MVNRAFYLYMLFAGVTAFAQGAPKSQVPDDPLRVQSVGMVRQAALLDMPSANAILDPLQCSADGSIYVQGFNIPSSYSREVYRVTDANTGTLLKQEFPEYQSVAVRSFYPGTHKLISLLFTRKQQLDQPAITGYALYISEPDGSEGKIVSLEGLKIYPENAAVLSSGQFLLLGVNEESDQPELLLLSDEGSLLRTLTMPGWTYDSSDNQDAAAEDQTRRLSKAESLASGAIFIPYRDEVLVVQPRAEFPVLVVNYAGSVRAVKLSLPSGDVPDSFITSDSNWIVLARTPEDSKVLATKQVLIGRPPTVFEVSPDGNVVRELQFAGIYSNDLACAVDGTFTALHVTVDDNPAQTQHWERWTAQR